MLYRMHRLQPPLRLIPKQLDVISALVYIRHSSDLIRPDADVESGAHHNKGSLKQQCFIAQKCQSHPSFKRKVEKATCWSLGTFPSVRVMNEMARQKRFIHHLYCPPPPPPLKKDIHLYVLLTIPCREAGVLKH